MNELWGVPGLTFNGLGIWAIVIYLVGNGIKTWLATRKLSIEDRTALNAGFTDQVKSLQIENRTLRGEVMEGLDKHRAYRQLCEAETEQLRNDVLGLRRQLSAIAMAALVHIPPDDLKGSFIARMIDEVLSSTEGATKDDDPAKT